MKSSMDHLFNDCFLDCKVGMTLVPLLHCGINVGCGINPDYTAF